MRDNIFSVFARDHNPLSYLLNTDANELAQSAARAAHFDALGAFAGESMLSTVAGVRRVPPTLGSLLPGRTGRGGWRDVEPGVQNPTIRIYYDIQVLGDDEVLAFWPDKTDRIIRPVDQELIDALGGDLRTTTDEDSRRFYESDSRWIVENVRTPDGAIIVRLSTWTDLTEEELAQPAMRNQVAALFRQRHAEAEAIVAAIATQMTTFYDVELPEELRVRAAASKVRLDNLHEAFTTIGLPTEWKMAHPVVVALDGPPGASIEGLPVPVRARLEPVSYADIQRTIRIWADKVEECPEAFAGLVEDRMSDLLCATLNAASPGAGREVYSRGGKTDIHIRADSLREGLGPASVFVLEAKWVGGREDIESAIADQLMRYVPVAATSTVLLAMSRRRDVDRATSNIRSWARGVEGFTGELHSDVEGWPIYTYRIAELGDLEMKVCIATVQVPPVPMTRVNRGTVSTGDIAAGAIGGDQRL